MIEAVNSVLSNAPFTKAVVEQQSVVNSFAANPARVQQATIQAPYISLYIKVDTNFDKAVLQIRDSDTGDVVRQIPTESQLEAYRRAQSSNAVRPAKVEKDFALTEAETPQVEQSAPTPTRSYTSDATTPVAAPAPAPANAVSAAPAPSAPQTSSVDTQA